MGRTHAQCLVLNPRVRLVGIADADPVAAQRHAGELGLKVPVAASLGQMLEEVESMAVDLCLPTDLHRSQAQVAFDHGRHVFCEKPLALTSPDAEAMVRGAEKAGVFLMVGHCLRFWPEYRELERLVRSREFGALKALTMRRSSGRPDYAANNWTADSRRCLGAALDLHIHDADFLHHLLGLPRAVTSRGVRYGSGWDHIETLYDYGGPCVSAGGGWDYPSRWGFRMEYHATFEGGALNFDSCLSPALHKCAAEGRPVPVKLPAGPVAAPAGLVAYAEELDYFCVHIASGVPPKIANGVQAAESLRLVLAEIQSAETGQTVKL